MKLDNMNIIGIVLFCIDVLERDVVRIGINPKNHIFSHFTSTIYSRIILISLVNLKTVLL